MFKHLLVPLDGSELAEGALPAAVYLAEALDASVTLIHVLEHNAPKVVHGQRHLRDSETAQHYLAEIAKRTFPAGIPLDQHVHTVEVGNVARSLVEHSEEFKPDLIVMCSHGSSGLRDWLFGSIAQQVIALGTTSVLVIQPAPEVSRLPFSMHQLLSPLDGDPSHEQGLTVAAELTQACNSALHLLAVVPTINSLAGEEAATGRLLPGAMTAMLEVATQDAEEYVNRHCKELCSSGLRVTTEIARGDPTKAIVNSAERITASLIVLGTHRKTGTEAFWARSVAPKVSSRTGIPLLLVPLTTDSV